MDVAVERPLPSPPPPVKEEKKAESMERGSAPPIVFESFPTSTQREPTTNKAQPQVQQQEEEGDNKLEATKAEMGSVREENERLKTLLSHIVRDYQSLHTHFLHAVKPKSSQPQPTAAAVVNLLPLPLPAAPAPTNAEDLVSLSLGRRPNAGAGRIKAHHERSSSSSSGTHTDREDQLSLGLSSRPSNDDDDKKATLLNLSSGSSADADAVPRNKQMDAAGAACPPATTTARKSPSAGAGDGGADDEVLQQQAKKARVSVRVKCDTPTMNDGCQWRKYGQKISKGNPCPRAYYRCTVAPSCPVRKQVQRCADDMSILITTYEGAHSHPLPPAAAAMASTTSAAASMLLAGPSTSSAHLLGPFGTSSAAHHGGLLGPATTISTVASCPTVTLDLTAPPHSSLMQQQHHPSSSPYAAAYESSKAMLPAAWSSGAGYLQAAYGGGSSYYGKNSISSMSMLPMAAMTGGQQFGLGMARPAAEQMYQSTYLQRTTSGAQQQAAAPAVTDTIAKAITADPSFQSVLAAAITSYMGRGAGAAAQHK